MSSGVSCGVCMAYMFQARVHTAHQQPSVYLLVVAVVMVVTTQIASRVT